MAEPLDFSRFPNLTQADRQALTARQMEAYGSITEMRERAEFARLKREEATLRLQDLRSNMETRRLAQAREQRLAAQSAQAMAEIAAVRKQGLTPQETETALYDIASRNAEAFTFAPTLRTQFDFELRRATTAAQTAAGAQPTSSALSDYAELVGQLDPEEAAAVNSEVDLTNPLALGLAAGQIRKLLADRKAAEEQRTRAGGLLDDALDWDFQFAQTPQMDENGQPALDLKDRPLFVEDRTKWADAQTRLRATRLISAFGTPEEKSTLSGTAESQLEAIANILARGNTAPAPAPATPSRSPLPPR